MQGAFKRAALRIHNCARGRGDPLAGARIGEQGGQSGGQTVGIGDRFGAMRVVERLVDLGEVPDMRPVQNGGAELGRFDRVLSAVLAPASRP